MEQVSNLNVGPLEALWGWLNRLGDWSGDKSPQVELATRIAGEDQQNDWIRTIDAGPKAPKIYGPAELGINRVSGGVAQNENIIGNWVDCLGYSRIFVRFFATGTLTGGNWNFGLYTSTYQNGDSLDINGQATIVAKQYGAWLSNGGPAYDLGNFGIHDNIADVDLGMVGNTKLWRPSLGTYMRVDVLNISQANPNLQFRAKAILLP